MQSDDALLTAPIATLQLWAQQQPQVFTAAKCREILQLRYKLSEQQLVAWYDHLVQPCAHTQKRDALNKGKLTFPTGWLTPILALAKVALYHGDLGRDMGFFLPRSAAELLAVRQRDAKLLDHYAIFSQNLGHHFDYDNIDYDFDHITKKEILALPEQTAEQRRVKVALLQAMMKHQFFLVNSNIESYCPEVQALLRNRSYSEYIPHLTFTDADAELLQQDVTSLPEVITKAMVNGAAALSKKVATWKIDSDIAQFYLSLLQILQGKIVTNNITKLKSSDDDEVAYRQGTPWYMEAIMGLVAHEPHLLPALGVTTDVVYDNSGFAAFDQLGYPVGLYNCWRLGRQLQSLKYTYPCGLEKCDDDEYCRCYDCSLKNYIMDSIVEGKDNIDGDVNMFRALTGGEPLD